MGEDFIHQKKYILESCHHHSVSNKEIADNIDQFGCFIVHVEGDDYLPGFTYTIGLFQQYNHPEIICFGLASEVAGSMLNYACEQVAANQVFKVQTPYSEFIDRYTIQFIDVDESYYQDYFGTANHYYHHTDYPVLQLIWPDKEGYFPWDPAFNPNFKFRQPLLDRNTDFKFNEERDVAVFTSAQVLTGSPILFVFHDEDGYWQFHSEPEPDLSEAKLVSLESIVKMDPTVNELFQLSPGQWAKRGARGDTWEWGP